jgi:small subunit ribosomal protein S10
VLKSLYPSPFDLRALESTVWKIMSLLIKSWAKVKWPIPLPKKKRIYTVLRSHFVYKDSREQFERIVYSRLIDVIQLGPKTIETLQNASIPVGVSVEAEVY